MTTWALTGLAMVIAAVAARQATLGQRLIAEALLGLVGLALVARYQRVAALALIGMAATVFLPEFVPLTAGGIRSDVPELLLYALLATTAAQMLTSVPRATIGGLLAAGLIAVLAQQSAVGLLHGADRGVVQGQVKAALFLLILAPLARLFATSREKALLERAVLWFCTAGSIWILYLLARGLPIPSPIAIYDFNTLGTIAHVERIRSPLLELLTVGTTLVLARIYDERATPVRVIQLLLFTAVWGFSFFRSAWFGLLAGLVVIAVMRQGPRRPLRGLRITIAISLVVPVLAIASAHGVLGKPAHEVYRRAASVFTPQIRTESSYSDRAQETREALRAVAAHPVLGVGLARPYGAKRVYYDYLFKRDAYDDRLFSHNTYLDLWLHLGLAGIALLLAAVVTLVKKLRTTLRRAVLEDTTRAVGAAAAIAALGVKALFIPLLLYRPAILAVAVAVVLLLPVKAEEGQPDAG